MRVRWRARALRELGAILDYIGTQTQLPNLSAFPELGHPTNVAGVRTKLIPGYPYRLFYTTVEDRREIRILRVRDVRRRPIYKG